MASEFSFDIVSRVDRQELDNALNQARREIETRFDFKNSKTSVDFDGTSITLVSDDELKMRNVIDILQQKAVRRGIDLRAFDVGTLEPAFSGNVRQTIALRNGIPKDKGKTLLDKVKSLKLKVNAQFQDEHVRVTAKSKDDLQKVIAALRAGDFELPLQFVNFR